MHGNNGFTGSAEVGNRVVQAVKRAHHKQTKVVRKKNGLVQSGLLTRPSLVSTIGPGWKVPPLHLEAAKRFDERHVQLSARAQRVMHGTPREARTPSRRRLRRSLSVDPTPPPRPPLRLARRRPRSLVRRGPQGGVTRVEALSTRTAA